MYKDEKIFRKALDYGIKGYVLKDEVINDIVHAVTAVYDGKYYLSPNLSGLLINQLNKSPVPDQEESALSKLTPTELTILKKIAELKSNIEIAGELFISQRTVENHRVNIARKLELHGTHSVLKYAVDNKNHIQKS